MYNMARQSKQVFKGTWLSCTDAVFNQVEISGIAIETNETLPYQKSSMYKYLSNMIIWNYHAYWWCVADYTIYNDSLREGIIHWHNHMLHWGFNLHCTNN